MNINAKQEAYLAQRKQDLLALFALPKREQKLYRQFQHQAEAALMGGESSTSKVMAAAALRDGDANGLNYDHPWIKKLYAKVVAILK